MFIGHFALGFAAKRVAPRLSLAALFAAVALADIIWPLLVAVGIEEVRIDPGNTAFTPLDFVSYPYSHSLVFLCLWGVVFGLICAGIVQDRRAALIAGVLVISHWVLDWMTHRPDMTASSLHNIAASVRSAAACRRPRRQTRTAASETRQSSSSVLPLIQRSAILMPWKLNIHAATANNDAEDDSESRRARTKRSPASASSRIRLMNA